MDSLPKKTSEKKSSEVFCKNFFTKVLVYERFNGHEVGHIGKAL